MKTALVGVADDNGKIKHLELVRDDHDRAADMFRNHSLTLFRHEPQASELATGEVRLDGTLIFVRYYDYEPEVETLVDFLTQEFM